MAITRTKLPGGLINQASQHLVGAGELFTTGNIWYVDSASGSDGNAGKDPDFPYATIDTAVEAAVANNGDIIVLMPNHAQTISNATGFLLDKAGLTVLGLGSGRNRPTFTLSAVGSRIAVTAADCAVKNCVFLAGAVAVTTGVGIAASDFVLENCEFGTSSVANNFSSAVVDIVSGQSRVSILGNKFVLPDFGTSVNPVYGIHLSNYNDVVIDSNYFNGACTSAVVSDVGGAEGDSSAIGIFGNFIFNSYGGTTASAIDLNEPAEGMIAYNAIFQIGGNATFAGFFDPANAGCVENYATTAVNRSAILIPATQA